jgi:hypothetical protein
MPGERTANLTVAVSSKNPSQESPASGNYQVCSTIVDSLKAGETRTFPCSKVGRYVIVQRVIGNEILGLCEVQVFGTSECVII